MDRKRGINKEELDTNTCDSVNFAAKKYPSLASVLSNAAVDVACFNLDGMQDELEQLFVSLCNQHNEFSNELFNFESLLAENEENIKELNGRESNMPTSEKKMPEKKSISSDNGKKLSHSGRARSKPVKTQDLEFPLKSDFPKQQKHEAPNRFWTTIDEYCTDITMDHTKIFEKWIESHDRDLEYQDISELGVHYSTTWTDNDILEEIKEGSKCVENPKGMECNSIEDHSGADILNRLKEENISQSSEPPPLIQKLILSLVNENIIASSDVMAETIPENEVPEVTANEPKPRPQVIENSLESRLLADLEEAGILEKTLRDTDDELLQELKQMQAFLIPVSRYNLQKKKELLARSKAEIAKQESQKRIQEADAKVMESYRVMSSARTKGKKMSKNEFYLIRTILEEREALIKSSRAED